jgi:hypothetical protein
MVGPAIGRATRQEVRLMPTRKVKRILALVAMALVAGGAFVASAEARDVLHFSGTSPLIVHDFPAGTLCDFTYHQEFTITSHVNVFFEEGNPVQVEEQIEAAVVHRNLDTGLTLTEVLRYALHFDLVAGEVQLTGNNWLLHDAGDRIVFEGSGMFIRDLFTGELVRATPNVFPDLAETICSALGGSPA